MFSQGLIEEQRTRGHLLFPISVSRVGSHFSLSLDVCLWGQAMTMIPVTSSHLFRPYHGSWAGAKDRVVTNRKEGRVCKVEI